MNCFQCVHRESVPGNAHIKCGKVKDSQLKETLAMLTTPRAQDYVAKVSARHGVELDKHGVDRGWCFWPLLFDPIWVYVCPHFEGVRPEYKPETKGGK